MDSNNIVDELLNKVKTLEENRNILLSKIDSVKHEISNFSIVKSEVVELEDGMI